MITQTNSNIGPRGKKPKNLSFPLYFRPKPKDKGGVDFGLPPHFYSLDIHAWNSYFQAPISSRITSLLFPPSLSAETHTHIHKYLSNSLKNTQEHILPLHSKISKFRKLSRGYFHKLFI